MKAEKQQGNLSGAGKETTRRNSRRWISWALAGVSVLLLCTVLLVAQAYVQTAGQLEAAFQSRESTQLAFLSAQEEPADAWYLSASALLGEEVPWENGPAFSQEELNQALSYRFYQWLPTGAPLSASLLPEEGVRRVVVNLSRLGEAYAQEAPGLLEQALPLVEDWKARCDALGVEFTCIASPGRYPLGDASGNEAADFYRQLAQITPFFDLTPSAPCPACDSREPGHFCREAASLALTALGDRSASPVTVETMEPFTATHFQEVEDTRPTVAVPVILYHHLDEKGVGMGINPQNFEDHLRALQKEGYETVSVQDMIDYVEQGKPLPEKPICITFDDGYRSNYTIAYPLLEELGMKATIFAIGVSVGKDTYKETGKKITPHFTYEEMAEMANSGVISIQSHSYDMHQTATLEEGERARVNFQRLRGETEEQYISQITQDFTSSLSRIESFTGQPVNALAFPYGVNDMLGQSVLSSLGVQATFSIEPGKATLIKGYSPSLIYMNRYLVLGETTPERLLQWIK